jgi:hypothetical protein
MLRIKLTTNFPDWPLKRQTPGCSKAFADCQFSIDDPDVTECDLWVVYEGMPTEETVSCPAGGTLLMTAEPAAVHEYHPRFVAQFDTVITSQSQLRHTQRLLAQQCQPWHAGVARDDQNRINLDYDAFAAANTQPKTKLLSVVCSDKKMIPEHRQRLRFIETLRQHFGDRLHVFGRGQNPINDKWEAIAPYRYHITLENAQIDHYWTEKLADAYLGLAYPIYYGCSNLAEYFSRDAFTAIDIFRPQDAIATIENVLAADLYAARLSAVQRAKQLVLDRYNLFAVLAQFGKQIASTVNPSRRVTLCPERNAFWARRAYRYVSTRLRNRSAA